MNRLAHQASIENWGQIPASLAAIVANRDPCEQYAWNNRAEHEQCRGRSPPRSNYQTFTAWPVRLSCSRVN
jgi:hypothetical protein